MDRKQRAHIHQTATNVATVRVTQQQLLNAELLGLGDDDLKERVENELNENVALEEGKEEKTSDDEDLDIEEDEHKNSDLDETVRLDDGEDDELPVYTPGGSDSPVDMPVGDTKSFVDDLLNQIGEHTMADEKQEELVEYLICSLNDNGFIDRPLESISDDLLFNHNIDASPEELESALKVLQSFDPPGIGARDLRECMLLQLQRKIDETPKVGKLHRLTVLDLAHQTVEQYFDLFKNKELKKLAEKLNIQDEDILDDVFGALQKLNPRPGLSLNESAGDRTQTIVPDFVIETSIEGNISFSLRDSRIPPLRVSKAYQELIDASSRVKLTASQKEDLKHIKLNVERAESFIGALRKRRETLSRTMHSIIQHQRAFMLSQDDGDLLPLTGGEIAKAVGVDNSTISRAISNRYALLDGTLYPLKKFFLRTRRNADGDEVLGTQVAMMLQEIIDGEDKKNPLSDSEISEILVSRGMNIRRRTVAKYRDQLHIPVARMRRVFK